MKKCPNCNRDIPDDAKICPYCGMPQKGYVPMKRTKQKKNNLYIILALFFIISPMVMNFIFLNDYAQTTVSEPSKQITLGALSTKDVANESTVYQFNSLSSFKKKVSNSSKYVEQIKSNEKQLEAVISRYNGKLNKEYQFNITDSNNLYTYLTYSFLLEDSRKVDVNIEYDLTTNINEISITSNQNNLEDFSQMKVNDENYQFLKDIVNIYTNDQQFKSYNSASKAFNNLETEFINRQGKLGNYGVGVTKEKKESSCTFRILSNKDKYRLKMVYRTSLDLNKVL